ncbi:MAG: DoxX family protein [Anderseniella sp.]|nr:DoxX family protein [Anderseniella sp.]
MSTAAGGIELVGGILIVLGLFTSPVAFLCSGMAAVGYWMSHGTKDLIPINNGGQIIALYCFIFLFIATHSKGIWSLDRELFGNTSSKVNTT